VGSSVFEVTQVMANPSYRATARLETWNHTRRAWFLELLPQPLKSSRPQGCS
jgi:hypothetical protein